MEVIPLLLTQTNWPIFIKKCDEVLKISPSKNLDKQSINLATPISLLASLPVSRTPQENLSDCSSPILNHIFLGFLFISPKKKMQNILLNLSLDYYVIGTNDDDDSIAIVSGTLRKWYHVIMWGSSLSQPKIVRTFCNKCYEYLKSAGFGQIWDANQRTLEDGTFILCRK